MNHNEHNQTNEILDYLASNSFIPLILQTTIITSSSNTSTDNIFSNVINLGIISGNWNETISDHLPRQSHEITQSEITCSKLTIETLEQGVKYVQS